MRTRSAIILAVGLVLSAAAVGYAAYVPPFPDGALQMLGSTSGKTTLKATAAASGTITFPAATGAVPLLSASQSWTAAQAVTPAALSDGATITPDCSAANDFTVTLGGDRTMANCSPAAKAGQSLNFYITQDGSGARQLSWGANYKWASGSPPALSSAPGASDLISCRTSSTTVYICAMAIQGYS